MGIRRIYESIRNVIRWFPVIWKDRDWDHYFFFEMLRFKLSNMEKYLRKYGHHVNAERDADDIHTCVLLLDRIIKDEYHENVFKYHDKKWGEPKMEFLDCAIKPLVKLEITHANVKTEEDKMQEIKEFRILSKKEAMMMKQDIDFLFKTMSKKILGWWD